VELCHGGVLIRAIEDLSTGTLLDGPCITVDHILHTMPGLSEVAQLVKQSNFDWNAFNPESCLYLRECSASSSSSPGLAHRVVFSGPRVGLSLRDLTGSERLRFITRNYRFLSTPKQTKKGKANIIIGLYKQGKDAAAIHHLTGTAIATIHKYIDLVESGMKEEDPIKLIAAKDTPDNISSNQIGATDLCKLAGACLRFEDE